MARTSIGFFLLVLLFSALSRGNASARESGNLYDAYGRSGKVKIYVDELTDESGTGKMDLAGLKAALIKSFSGRKSVAIEPVSDRKDADLVVAANVTEYYWTEHDPTDFLVGLGGTIYDAMTQEHYARLQAVFTVSDARTNRVAWHEKLKTTVTDATMTEAESVGRVNEGISKVFIKECFGKKRAR